MKPLTLGLIIAFVYFLGSSVRLQFHQSPLALSYDARRPALNRIIGVGIGVIAAVLSSYVKARP